MGLRRLRHVPVDGRRPARALGAAGQGRAQGSTTRTSTTSSSSSTGRGTSIPSFKDSHYLEPIVAAGGDGEGYVDRWIVYGKVDGKELFTAKELTVKPGAKVTIKDNGAYGLIAVQGSGRIGKTPANAGDDPLRELTEDEYFVSHGRPPRRA